MKLPKQEAWSREVPQARTIRLRSSADGALQPVLFYDSGSKRDKPLLLVLHSWMADYRQQFSIPYGVFAVKNDWIFIHPDFRGEFTDPNATASEFAVSDVLDALAYARAHSRVDTSRIYIAGFSGGGMMALLMAGRYPKEWAGVVAWVPVYDLVKWYSEKKGARHDYSGHIERSCGGPPLKGTSAEKECARRSPSSYLKNVRSDTPEILIVTGIRDNFVPPSHSIRAFNDLSTSGDRISDRYIGEIDSTRTLPSSMTGTFPDSLFEDAGLKVLLRKRSAKATLIIHDGKHDVIYNAGLQWLDSRRR